jgi:hypothetical protein
MTALMVDPLVCLASRELESPDDWAPPCGAWDSDHCQDCRLCPGVHAEDCEMGSDIRMSCCGGRWPYHNADCGRAATHVMTYRPAASEEIHRG